MLYTQEKHTIFITKKNQKISGTNFHSLYTGVNKVREIAQVELLLASDHLLSFFSPSYTISVCTDLSHMEICTADLLIILPTYASSEAVR